jgi:molybdate transport system substrate-binding protein
MPRGFRIVPALALSLLLAVTACSSDSKTATTASSTSAASSSSAPTATGSLTVFAAASLTEAFNDEQATLKASAPGLTITYSFAGSGALVTQIQHGAPADVIATADTASMKKLTDAGLVETPTTFAHNKLQILVAPGNPLGIKALGDLARSGIKLVLCDESVPAGKYATQALAAAGVTVSPVSKELDVKAAVAKVTGGEADVSIVYVTDVTAAGSKGQGVEIPDAQNVVADYPIAVVKATKNPVAAGAFIDAIVKGSGQDALKKRGFLPSG